MRNYSIGLARGEKYRIFRSQLLEIRQRKRDRQWKYTLRNCEFDKSFNCLDIKQMRCMKKIYILYSCSDREKSFIFKTGAGTKMNSEKTFQMTNIGQMWYCYSTYHINIFLVFLNKQGSLFFLLSILIWPTLFSSHERRRVSSIVVPSDVFSSNIPFLCLFFFSLISGTVFFKPVLCAKVQMVLICLE